MRNKGTRFFSTVELKMIEGSDDLKRAYEKSYPYYSSHTRGILSEKSHLYIEIPKTLEYQNGEISLDVVDLYRSEGPDCPYCGDRLAQRDVTAEGRTGAIVKKRLPVCIRCCRIFIAANDIYETLLQYNDKQIECHLH